MRTEYLTPDEVARLCSALTPANRLVCEVSASTGLRVGDVLALRSDELASEFCVTESKTGKRKEVRLSDELLERLRAQAGSVWVFEGRGGPEWHRTRQAVWRDVKMAARTLHLPQNVAPHSFRKVYAVNLLDRSGGDLRAVQADLNHDESSTTMIYAMAGELYRAKYGESSDIFEG